MPNRKISVSFVSEAIPTTSNDPYAGRRDPRFKYLQQKLLRLQVMQIVLGLTLMILSSVAVIEERIIFGLGFSLISALVVICCSVIGIQQTNPKILFIVNMVALCGLIPAFNYTFQSLSTNFWYRFSGRTSIEEITTQDSITDNNISRSNRDYTILIIPSSNEDERNFTTTIWIVGWVEMFHLIPLAISLLYSTYLLKYINHYYSVSN